MFLWSFYHFVPIFLKILRLFNVIKIAVNLFMQWKECLTNGQMLARSDHYIFFFTICMKFFFGQMFANISCILLLCDFFLQMIQQCCGCPFFYIFSRHYKHCRYLKYNTWVMQFLIEKKIMIMNPCHIRSTKSKSNPRKYCIETAKNSHTSKIWVKSS